MASAWVTMAGFMPMLMGALAWHRQQLVTRPYTTNAVTSGTLMIIGDRIAQRIEGGRGRVLTQRESGVRTGVLATWSACVSAPFWTWWYMYLDRRLPGKVMAWVAITAVVPAPAWNLLFFTAGTALEHLFLVDSPLGKDSLEDLQRKMTVKVEQHFVPTVLRSASVWIPVNCLNFYFVPRDYRTTFGASIGLLWNVYMSLIQHTEHEEAAGAVAATAVVGGADVPTAIIAIPHASAGIQVPASSLVGRIDEGD